MAITKIGNAALHKNIRELTAQEVQNLRKDIKDLPPPNVGKSIKAFGFFEGEELAGLVMVDTNPTKGFYRSKKEDLGHDQEITFFWVRPEYRGKGIGRQLLSFATDRFGSSSYLGLGTGGLTTEGARHLYTSSGFSPIMTVQKNSWWLRKPTDKTGK